MTRNLERAEEELGLVKKQMEDSQGAATEVASLKKALAEAEDKVAKERAAREKQEARVSEVQQELQDAVKKYESLERDSKTQESELAKARQSTQDARAEAQSALREIQVAQDIAAGAFADLPRSISDAAEFFRAEEESSTEKLFWSQYLGSEHPSPLSDQLKQLVELHKAAELAMKDLIVRLWPAEPVPSSYFGLVKRLVSACRRLDAIKRSVCIEGAWMAFARAKTHWAKMDATKLITEGPPEGEEHRKPEMY